jgi:hypothetical protein
MRRRSLHQQGKKQMAKVVCVLYDDPIEGYPKP